MTGKFGDTVGDNIYTPGGMLGCFFGISPTYLSSFRFLINYVNSSDTFSSDFAGLESLMRSYFRHLNILNLLTNHINIPIENAQNAFQDICRVAFEVSIYLYYILILAPTEGVKDRSNAYEASAYQTVAKFFQHFPETSFSFDSEYISEIKGRADIKDYLESSRARFMKNLPKADFNKQAPDSLEKDWTRDSQFWANGIDNHKWYDNGTNWSSFYALISGLSDQNNRLMDYYYLVYQPCCSSVHSRYSSNVLALSFPANYPSVTSSDQDASSMWPFYFVRMLVWYSYKLSLIDDSLKDTFKSLQDMFNKRSKEARMGEIIDNNGKFIDFSSQGNNSKENNNANQNN